MIARQRQNLRRTFAANELGNASETTIARLTTTETELLEATDEFALGAARFGPAPELDDATLAMEQAVSNLQMKKLDEGQFDQQRALAALVRARENLRQMLSMSSGSSASQCRTFDHQQRQKLRSPEDLKQQLEQQVAQLRENFDQLAQQQRQWSEDVRSGSGGPELDRDAPPPSSSSSSSGASSQEAQQQEQALAEAQRLQQQMRDSQASSELAQQRMDAAASAIGDSLDDLKAGNSSAAAEMAADVAEQLEALSDHLEALNAADFSEQLGHAQRLAQRLADEQAVVTDRMSAPPPGDGDRGNTATPSVQQRAVADAAEMLADVIARASAAVLEEDREIREALAEMTAANSPRAIAQTMNEAAAEYEAGALAAARQSAAVAHRDISDLAMRLRQARQQYAQPRLEELVDAEQAVADLIDGFKSSDARGLLDSELAEVERQIEALARRDSRLAKAVSQSPAAPRSNAQNLVAGGAGGTTDDAVEFGAVSQSSLGRPPTMMGRGLREMAVILQTRIQEVILASVQMDADEALPPEYRELVDRYYRALSEDLR